MKLTKFQHACLSLEKDGHTLLVDPGNFTHDFIMPKHVAGIIITHDHPGHLDASLVAKILTAHPKAIIIGHESITTKYSTYATMPVVPAQPYEVAGFTLQFFGGSHTPIAEGITTPPNLGVLVDNSLYYPGDSFVVPAGVSVKTLALPVSAPWLTVAQTRSFLKAIKPAVTFPTHDGLLSEDGKKLMETMVGGYAQSLGITYQRLDEASLELA